MRDPACTMMMPPTTSGSVSRVWLCPPTMMSTPEPASRAASPRSASIPLWLNSTIRSVAGSRSTSWRRIIASWSAMYSPPNRAGDTMFSMSPYEMAMTPTRRPPRSSTSGPGATNGRPEPSRMSMAITG